VRPQAAVCSSCRGPAARAALLAVGKGPAISLSLSLYQYCSGTIHAGAVTLIAFGTRVHTRHYYRAGGCPAGVTDTVALTAENSIRVGSTSAVQRRLGLACCALFSFFFYAVRDSKPFINS